MDKKNSSDLPNSTRFYEETFSGQLSLIPTELPDIIERILKENSDISMREILEDAQRIRQHETTVTPKPIIAFVCEIIKATNCKRLYVPFAIGTEVEEFDSNILSIDYSNLSIELRYLIQEKTGILSVSNDDGNVYEYDVIYSNLPLGPIRKDCLQKKVVEESIDKLAPNGVCIFTFGNNIVFESYAHRWLSELSEKGLFVSAVIDLPRGLYYPVTLVSSKIVVFSKKKTDKLFIAKLEKETDASTIANNYLSIKSNKRAETLGKWIDHNTFPDFELYENEQRSKRNSSKLEKAYSGSMLPISEISTDVLTPRKSGIPFSDMENAVYIPKLGKSDVVTSLSDLQLKPQNYFQILVNQEMILPEFLSFFFNTDEGMTIRTRAYSGAAIPSLNIKRIRDMKVPVPSLKTQTSVLNVCAELDEINMEVSRLKNKLKRIPASHANVAIEIKDINNKGDKFEQWIDSLPYPLATILRRYITSNRPQQKQELLLCFFEAYAIFTAAILTAIYQQPQFRDSPIPGVDKDYFKKASFGSWVRMDRAIAKIFRSKMNDSKGIDFMLNSFHTDDQSLVRLMSQDIYKILDKTCEYRNSWKGHSGITSETIYNDHVRLLEVERSKLQEKLKDLYEKIRLVRPIGLKLRQGEFSNKVEVLTGSNPIFKKEDIVGEALDENKLYIQVIDTAKTFEVPPFFVMKNSPADVKNACYFYSRVEGSNSRYVSYHFDTKPEDTEEGEAAFDIISAILENQIKR